MGTRADFYVGTGKDAEWLGSIAYDGYRIQEVTQEASFKNIDALQCWTIKTATNEQIFRRAVAELLKINDDATLPEQGWPWPWGDSNLTDRSYCFADDKCKMFAWGAEILGPKDDGDFKTADTKAEWPDMRGKQNVTFGHRSGALFIQS